MTIKEWTPRFGLTERTVTRQTYQDMVVSKLRDLVRETAYNLMKAENSNISELTTGEAYSRACDLRQRAVDTLRMFDPAAESFIEATYQPKAFLHD